MTTIDPVRTDEHAEQGADSSPRRGTGTRATRAVGILALVALVWLVAFGLGFSPADRDQQEAVRILYMHVPTVWVAYLAFIVTAFGSAMYLFTKKKSLGWDRIAGASAEVGVVFVAVTLAVGAMWGRLTWGVFWQWDARLTTTALLFVTYIGYLAVRRLGGTHDQRAKRSAVLGLIAVVEIPLVHWSVRLWRSLHQEATVLDTDLDASIDGTMLFSLFVGVIAFTLVYVWLMMHRTRAMAMEDLVESSGLDDALLARRAEANLAAGTRHAASTATTASTAASSAAPANDAERSDV